MSAANLPVIVGAGQYVNRSRDIADAVEPLDVGEADRASMTLAIATAGSRFALPAPRGVGTGGVDS